MHFNIIQYFIQTSMKKLWISSFSPVSWIHRTFQNQPPGQFLIIFPQFISHVLPPALAYKRYQKPWSARLQQIFCCILHQTHPFSFRRYSFKISGWSAVRPPGQNSGETAVCSYNCENGSLLHLPHNKSSIPPEPFCLPGSCLHWKSFFVQILQAFRIHPFGMLHRH